VLARLISCYHNTQVTPGGNQLYRQPEVTEHRTYLTSAGRSDVQTTSRTLWVFVIDLKPLFHGISKQIRSNSTEKGSWCREIGRCSILYYFWKCSYAFLLLSDVLCGSDILPSALLPAVSFVFSKVPSQYTRIAQSFRCQIKTKPAGMVRLHQC